MLCETCKKKECLVEGKGYGKPCDALECELRALGVKGRDWIRPRVSPKRDKKQGIGRWREIPSGLIRPGIDEDYAGDM